MLEVDICPYRDDLDTDLNVPYHIRCALDRDNKEIRLCVIDQDGTPITIVITGVLPLLGHEKSQVCCGG